ncbi:BTAD domain-containing putative transcriptional regulator [Plantactinospora sp. GCM10030261]|uniref:BTAD domain-containing putative transcriptional regulator n=1 Tax=Plantactinospora sp. GCM10030261 TaxID=3273420 RepID=UPI003610D30E
MRIAMLGPLAVADGSGAPIRLAGTRLRRLLILLALEAGEVVGTRRLADGVWDGVPPAGTQNALQALVSRLRRALPEATIESHPAGYRLTLPVEAVDVVRFERLAARGRHLLLTDPAQADQVLAAALELWRGPALADLTDTGVVHASAARLEELRLAAVEDRAEARLTLGAFDALVPELRAVVTAHPLRERAAGQLIRALRAAGRPAEALDVFDRVRTTLADTLGTDPSAELAALHRDLLGAATPVPADVRRLPAGLTSFVGREDDCRRVADLMSTSRLITLIGPGGAGKTRLAVESARALVGRTPDGVRMAELAPVTDPAEVPYTVLDALGLREPALLGGGRSRPLPTDPVDATTRLATAIGGRSLLLVVDNCEHLLDAVATLVHRLLATCPALRVLATSREPLGITGEATWPVESLTLPPDGTDHASAQRYPAVRLFADRATAVRPDFAVNPETTADVIRICRALDGMPLAIELAAARLRAMTPAQVAARLDDRFRLLTGGSRTALPRHQTLRAVVDWSWDLLDPAERALLCRLSVFVGGATLDAIERVCAGPEVPAEDVVDRLSALVDKSLVVTVGEVEPRYRLLETIREYGRQRLAEAGEADRMHRAHAEEFLALAETTESRIRGPEQVRWLRRLSAEHDNANAGLRWASAGGDLEIAVRFVAALGWYWWLRGHRLEGAQIAEQTLTLPGADRVSARAYALAYANCALVMLTAGLDKGRSWLRRAAALAEAHRSSHPMLRLVRPLATAFDTHFGQPAIDQLRDLFDDEDPWLAATVRMFHAMAELNIGRPDRPAEAALESALARYRTLGDRWGLAYTQLALADLLSRRGDHAHAAEHCERALVESRALGTTEDAVEVQFFLAREQWHLGETERALEQLAEAQLMADRLGSVECRASVAYQHAEILRAQGRWTAARRRLEEAERLMADRPTSPHWQAMLSSSLGAVEAAEGDPEAARATHERALAFAVESHDVPVLGTVLMGWADLALRTDRAREAAVLLGAAAGVRGAPDRSLLEGGRIEAATRAALGAEFAECFDRGRGTTATTAIDLVRSLLDGVRSGG